MGLLNWLYGFRGAIDAGKGWGWGRGAVFNEVSKKNTVFLTCSKEIKSQSGECSDFRVLKWRGTLFFEDSRYGMRQSALFVTSTAACHWRNGAPHLYHR